VSGRKEKDARKVAREARMLCVLTNAILHMDTVHAEEDDSGEVLLDREHWDEIVRLAAEADEVIHPHGGKCE